MSMYFGMTGRLRSTGERSPLILVAVLAALGAALVPAARAQDEVCELPLTVPDVGDVTLNLQPNTRGPGILVSWPEPTPEISTSIRNQRYR